MTRPLHHPPHGLTLLELTFVILIIGFLALLIVPRVVVRTQEAQEKACFHNKAQLNAALERYFTANESWPADLGTLNVPDYFPSGIPVCPASGAVYSLNATTHRVEGHTTGNH